MLHFFSLIFSIPPVEKRPKESLFLRQVVPGYKPASVEAYILYRSFLLAFWIFCITTFIYFLPVGFGIEPGFWGITADNPVAHYQHDYPRRIFVWMVLASCFYGVLLAYLNRKMHTWSFAETRPVYIKNMLVIKAKSFPTVRLALIHVGLPIVLFMAIFYIGKSIDFLDSYILIHAIYDFSQETINNFIVLSLIYWWVFTSINSVVFHFLFMVFLERKIRHYSSLKQHTRKTGE